MKRLISFEALAKKVLIAPLHWGLGHATRCIPIIEAQLDDGAEVWVAASDAPRALLSSRFQDVQFIEIPFMEITYPADGNMVKHFFKTGPKMLLSIWKEHRSLQALIKKLRFDLVISDSRFGLWSSHTKTVFISHQIEIKTPLFQALINRLNRWVMNRYDEVWIPDYEAKPGLAGELSHTHPMPKHYRYIGPLSRFKNKVVPQLELTWDAVALISGPEPQRSLFEAETIRRYVENDRPLLLLRGKPDTPEERAIGNIKIVHHLEDDELLKELSRSKKVISRSGYSTIMDLNVLGIKAELFPTPGQTEQIYLAKLHDKPPNLA